MGKGTIMNIQRHCIHDGPGIRTTVFLKGCPLRCSWCCNPESQQPMPQVMFSKNACIGCGCCTAACSEKACVNGVIDRGRCTGCLACAEECYSGALKAAGQLMTVDAVMSEILRDEGYYENGGGVTLSGGEPFFQPEFAGDLLRALREERIHTLVETCGYFDWDACRQAVSHTERFFFDVKHCDDEQYIRYTGAPLGPILENLKRLLDMGKEVTVRIPAIRNVNLYPETFDEIGRKLSGLGYLGKVQLLPYHNYGTEKYVQLGREYGCPGGKTPSREELRDCGGSLERWGYSVAY